VEERRAAWEGQAHDFSSPDASLDLGEEPAVGWIYGGQAASSDTSKALRTAGARCGWSLFKEIIKETNELLVSLSLSMTSCVFDAFDEHSDEYSIKTIPKHNSSWQAHYDMLVAIWS